MSLSLVDISYVFNMATQIIQHRATNQNLNEWGKYIGNRDMVRIRPEGSVIKHVQTNNPAIRSVVATIEASSLVNWEAVGHHIGGNRYIKHLRLNIHTGADDFHLLAFCRGFAFNTSVEALEINFYSNIRGEAFTSLMPFFSGNSNLALLVVECYRRFDNFPASMKTAIDASTSLRSLRVGTCECYWKGEKLKNASEFIQSIFSKIGIQHIALHHFLLPEDVCSGIKDALSCENCELLSLELARVEVKNDADAVNVASGFKDNKSIKCFAIESTKDEFMKPFLASVQTGSLETLEKLELYSHFQTRGLPVASVVRHMPRLKSLRLDGPRFDMNTWKEIFSVIFYSSMLLDELKISRSITDDETLQDLSVAVSVSSIKALDLSDNVDITPNGWSTFLKSTKVETLEELHIQRAIKNDAVMTALSGFLAMNGGLKVLKFPRYNHEDVTEEGWRSLVAALQNHTSSLEEIVFDTGFVRRGGGQHLFVGALHEISSLKRVTMPINSSSEFQLLANVLESPNCAVEELTVYYDDSQFPIFSREHDGSLEETDLTYVVANALQLNVSLKVFRFQHCGRRLFQFNWALIADLLCNKTSIDASYNSNHTLERLEIINDRNSTIPLGLYSMVYFNQNTSKQSAARDKIVHCHKLDEMEYKPAFLPVIMSRIGESNSNRSLSHLYSIICKNRHSLQMC